MCGPLSGTAARAIIDATPTLERPMASRAPDCHDPAAATRAFAERYTPVGLLGAGSYAEVFRAVDRETGRAVALKILHDRVADSAVWPARERFEREVAVMRELRHPGIVPVLDHGYRPDPMLPDLVRPAIVLPLVEGETLAAVIARREPWPRQRVVRFLESTAEVLLHLQSHDIVHRDLGPQNVFVTPTGQFLVADFGMARPLDAAVVTRLSGTLTEALAARMLYVDAANAGGVLTSASDIISLARIAIALARGAHYVGPLRAGDRAVRDWPPSLVALLNEASEDGAAIGPQQFLDALRVATHDAPVRDAPRHVLDQPRRGARDVDRVREVEEPLPPRARTGDSTGLIYAGGVGLAVMGLVVLLRGYSPLGPDASTPPASSDEWIALAIPYVAIVVLGLVAFMLPPSERGGRLRKVASALFAILLAMLWFMSAA
jgi:serine/threonine protein kinase